MRLTSIVIPTYNGLELLKTAVEAIRRCTDQGSTPYEIVVADNGSADGTCEWCIGERISFIALPDNAGFPAACNKGLRLAEGDNLLLLNNDVTVTDGWLEGLTEALLGGDDIGIVGPMTNYASGRQQLHIPVDSPEEFQRIAREVKSGTDPAAEPVQRLVGFCMLFRRELYERIGELDERFSPGHYEDDDYCLRARMSGFGLRMCRNVLVHHRGSASFKKSGQSALQQLVERNRQRFIEKWRIDPAAFM